MNYRMGTYEDLDCICGMIKEAICNMDNNGIPQWDEVYPTWNDFKRDIDNDTLYVVEDERDLIAVYVINKEADEAYDRCTWSGTDEKACLLHRFCVSPKYQNRGLGRTILNYIENQAVGMGYTSIRLDVFTQNPYALKMYDRNEYLKRGYANWRKGRFVLMEKVLVQ